MGGPSGLRCCGICLGLKSEAANSLARNALKKQQQNLSQGGATAADKASRRQNPCNTSGAGFVAGLRGFNSQKKLDGCRDCRRPYCQPWMSRTPREGEDSPGRSLRKNGGPDCR